jgi:multiple antibiotic resistance protein
LERIQSGDFGSCAGCGHAISLKRLQAVPWASHCIQCQERYEHCGLERTRKLVARRIALNSFVLMIGSFAIGSHVLSFFGISLPVVQVGGGLVVIATGWAMLKQKDENERGAVQCTVSSTDVLREAFYPLTLPLTVGPGSISVAITLGANEPRRLGASLLAFLAAAIGCALVAATIYLCYGSADRLAVVIGPSGMNVVLKLSSFLLVCIGVQILWNGLSRVAQLVTALRVVVPL